MFNRLFITAAIALPFVALTPFSAAAQIQIIRIRQSTFDRPLLRGTPQFIVCGYSPSVRPNPLGQQASITVSEVDGSSTFRYNGPDGARSLTLPGTSIRFARRQLVNSPAQYAALIGRSLNDPIVLRGFSSVDRLLSCEDANERSAANNVRFDASGAVTNAIRDTAGRGVLRTTVSTRSSRSDADRVTTIASLPDGNYRFTTARASSGGGSINGVLQDSGDRTFTFRKAGESVTGNFVYVDSGESACVSGIVQGNTVVGQAVSNSFGTDVLGQRYLGSGLSLRLEENSGNFYNNATLSLGGFSRIDAGDVQPPASCRS